MNQQPPVMNQQPAYRRTSRMPWVILGIVVLAVVIVLGVLFRDKLGMGSSSSKEKLSGYQAVFLTNGQVYFGKMSNTNGTYVTLKDIYYLQVNQNLQAQEQQQQQQQQEPQLSLVKLGNELHGPADSMQINRDQILFFEDLKTDGRVAEAIETYKKNPNGTEAPAAQTPATQAPAQQAPATQTPTK